jgi:hypothetical protein
MSPYAVTTAVSKIEGVAAYQIIQEDVSQFTIRIVSSDSRKADDFGLIQEVVGAMHAAVGQSVSCEVRIETDIKPAPGRHKLPLVVSRVERTS